MRDISIKDCWGIPKGILFKANGDAKKALQAIEGIVGRIGSKRFREIFKSITCDNGSKFMDSDNMEHSFLVTGKKTTSYYVHPYSLWERGSNENGNGILRRFIPKGCDIGCYSKKKIREIQD